MNCYVSDVAGCASPHPLDNSRVMPERTPNPPSGKRRRRAWASALLLAAPLPRAGRAESSISYKYQDYRESGGRVDVETQGVHVSAELGPASRLEIEGVLDALAGATPTGQPAPAGSDQVPLARLTERRKAWSADYAHQWQRINVAAGVANSRESDYVSNGWSLNTLTDFNQKNTTLLAGVAGTRDRIKVFFQPERARKRTQDLLVGVTQLLSPASSITMNLSWGRQTGYLSDPYKLVQKRTEIVPGVSLPLTFPENRPAERDKHIVFLNYKRAWLEGRGVLDASYRFYHDSFGTDAHTVELAWFQRLGERVVLRPGVRGYDQSAAGFYRYRFDGTHIVPADGPPRPEGPFYSSDYRLSALRSLTVGLKLIWNVTPALQVDAALEHYQMRGTDGVTPQSAYARARILTGGVRWAW
jgi:hypothetical protein